MDKPTIFFSHSSKDKDTILPIKEKLCSITANVLDVFMSSDGQSIPFGNNWIHKIEEGLNKAQVMFVFVTPISVNSSWIYFEAGFAYSKNIEVIPVGIGISIGQLKPPLSLLQGFDITSTDSLNNFISIINRKFDLKFDFAFTDDTYNTVFASITDYSNHIDIGEIFKAANRIVCSHFLKSGKIVTQDINAWAANIKDYIKDKNIKFASHKNGIITGGIYVDIKRSVVEPDKVEKITFNLSTRNFEQNFALYKALALNCMADEEWIALSFELSSKYGCLQSGVDISSAVNIGPRFDYIEDTIDRYIFDNKVYFKIIKAYNEQKGKYEESMRYILVSFKRTDNVEYTDMVSLFDEMVRCGLIFKL